MRRCAMEGSTLAGEGSIEGGDWLEGDRSRLQGDHIGDGGGQEDCTGLEGGSQNP
jgi:hypothetical protein